MSLQWKILAGWRPIKGHPLGGESILEEVRLTPLRAIRRKCMDCTCWQREEVRHCPSTLCALWPYRMGRTPEPGLAQEVPRWAEPLA